MVNSSIIDGDANCNSFKSVIENSITQCLGQDSTGLALSAIQSQSASQIRSTPYSTRNMSESSVWGSSANGAVNSASNNALGWGSYMPSSVDKTVQGSMQLTGPFSDASLINVNNTWGNTSGSIKPNSTQPGMSTSEEMSPDMSNRSTQSENAGRTTPVWQGINFGTGFQKMGPTNDSWGSGTLGTDDMNKGTATTTTNGNAWSDTAPSTSVWGSLTTNSGASPNSSVTCGWPNTSPILNTNSTSGISREQNMTTPQWGVTSPAAPQWGGTAVSTSVDPAKTAPSTFAQAAGKGLNLKPNTNSDTSKSNVELVVLTEAEQIEQQKRLEIQRVIESHDGWGCKPVRQDYAWDVKVSPNTKRKQAEENRPNVWNNHNGTAIWEASKENPQVWNDDPVEVRESGDCDSAWSRSILGNRTVSESSAGPWPRAADKPPAKWPGPSQPPPGWNPPKPDNSSWVANNECKDRSSWSQQSPKLNESVSWPPTDIKPAPWPPTASVSNVGVPPMGKTPNSAGWGNHSPPGGKSDDGTHIWGSGPMTQATANTNPQTGQWGADTNGQWNSGPVMKSTSMLPTSSQNWSESSDTSWNGLRKQTSDGSWRDGSSLGSDTDVFSETDLGTWNDVTQEVNSTWSSATGWKNRPINMKCPTKFAVPMNTGPPQMRVKLLQQLTDIGKKKKVPTATLR